MYLVFGSEFNIKYFILIVKNFLDYIYHYENDNKDIDYFYNYYYKLFDNFKNNNIKVVLKDDMEEFINKLNIHLKKHFGFNFVYIDINTMLVIPYTNEEKLFVYKNENQLINLNTIINKYEENNKYEKISERFMDSQLNKNYFNINGFYWFLLNKNSIDEQKINTT